MSKQAATPAANGPIILGIETSGRTCAAGIWQNGTVLASLSYNIANVHSRLLSPTIESALQSTGLQISDLAALAVSAGPGSFTGLRIGFSIAKGIAHATGIPIIEVPTLDILAFQCGRQAQPIISLVDARRAELFSSRYAWKEGEFTRVGDYTLSIFEEINPDSQETFVTAHVQLSCLVVPPDKHKRQEQ